MRKRAPQGPRVDFRAVRLLALDFDGVLTDNLVGLNEQGVESVRCSRADGMGIAEVKRCGIEVVVLSTERNPVVAARCRKLEIAHVQGLDDKLTVLRELAGERGLEARQVAYRQDDRNDLECMRWAGLPIAVADAVEEVRRSAVYVATRPGGQGAVREICDLIVETKEQCMPKQVTVGERQVGRGHPVCVIAEIGINHNGDLEIGEEAHRRRRGGRMRRGEVPEAHAGALCPGGAAGSVRDTPWGMMTYLATAIASSSATRV